MGYKTDGKARLLSGLDELDVLTKGFEYGQVTIWTGVTNAGKTSVLTMLTKETIRQGQKIFYFNGEQTKEDFKNNIYKQSSNIDDLYDIFYKDTIITDTYVKEAKVRELDKIYSGNLFVFNNEAKRDINSLLVAMEDCRTKHGVRVFVLDNFMQIDLISNDIYQEQTQIMEKLRTYAVNKEVIIHLVAHPRKMAEFQTRLSLYDISGSMNLSNKAYNVISIIRLDMVSNESQEYTNLAKALVKQHFDIREADGLLEILKTKGSGCGLVPLKFNKKTRGYTQVPRVTAERYEKLVREF